MASRTADIRWGRGILLFERVRWLRSQLRVGSWTQVKETARRWPCSSWQRKMAVRILVAFQGEHRYAALTRIPHLRLCCVREELRYFPAANSAGSSPKLAGAARRQAAAARFDP